jgi:DNA-binding transcriptional MerR regulator
MGESEMRTLPEIAKRLDVEYRTLQSWVERGLISPTVESGGAGSTALYDEAAFVRIWRLVGLRKAGLSFEGVERYARDPHWLAADLFRVLLGEPDPDDMSETDEFDGAGCCPEEDDFLRAKAMRHQGLRLVVARKPEHGFTDWCAFPSADTAPKGWDVVEMMASAGHEAHRSEAERVVWEMGQRYERLLGGLADVLSTARRQVEGAAATASPQGVVTYIEEKFPEVVARLDQREKEMLDGSSR